MIFTKDTDGSYSLISQENGYVFADDRNADGSKDGTIGHRLYASQSDAQAYFDSVKGEASTSNLKDLIGKTLYQHVMRNGQDISISELTLQEDGKLKLIDFGETKLLPYEIKENILQWTDVYGKDSIELIEKTDKYAKFKNLSGKVSTFYFIKTDAENAPITDIG